MADPNDHNSGKEDETGPVESHVSETQADAPLPDETLPIPPVDSGQPTEYLDAVTVPIEPPPRRPPGAAPRRFGNYELIREIARGGMGVVYLARQPSLNRTVALKMILAGQLAGEKEVQRFYAEAEAAAQLDHPHIVPIYEVGTYDDRPYFAMAYVDGQNLAAYAQHQPLPPIEAAQLMRPIADAIEYAHQCGILHRDLKPQNVLIDSTGHARVTDFGLAKRLEADSELTGTGQILGTPSYMPPEQASGNIKSLDARADVYSLGAILYYLLAGRPPFQSSNPLDTLLQVIEQDPVAPRILNPAIPRDLNTICLKCLEKTPSRRYASAGEFGADLERFLNDEPIHARTLGVVGRVRRWISRRAFGSGLTAIFIGITLLLGALAGIVYAASTLATAGLTVFEDYDAPSATISIDPNKPTTSAPITVANDGLHELMIRLKIETSDFRVDEDFGVEPHFNFPVSYTVFDEKGNEIAKGSDRVVWNALTRMREGQTEDEQRGVVELATTASLTRFIPPSDGKITVKTEVGPDTTYGARPIEADIRIFEGVHDYSTSLNLGFSLCAVSPVVLIIGFALLIYGPILMFWRTRSARK